MTDDVEQRRRYLAAIRKAVSPEDVQRLIDRTAARLRAEPAAHRTARNEWRKMAPRLRAQGFDVPVL